MKRARGLTLVEVLITLVLIGVVVALLSGILGGMARMTTRSQEGERAVDGLAGLEEIRRELWEAVTIQSPTSATFVDQLELSKVDPNASGRLPQEPAVWAPHAQMLTVVYEAEGERVVRKVTAGSGGESSSTAIERVEGFSVALLDPGLLELRLSFSSGKRLKSYRALVRRYLP